MFKLWIILSVLSTFNGAFYIANAQTRCKNPNQSSGTCVSLYDCPNLLTLFQITNLSESTRNFISKSQCSNGSGRFPHVCCTGLNNGRATSNGRGNVLPTPPNCGPQDMDEKVYGGKETSLSDYVWAALLEYTEPSGNKLLKCGGSLINQRYVLTAAHCVTPNTLRVAPLTGVRLGEYDTTTPHDCIDLECADPIVVAGIEETIPHPEYSRNRQNDIGLIRLDRDIDYTFFIQPVCLPFMTPRQRSSSGISTGTVVGWGATVTSQSSPKKLQLKISITDMDECKRLYAERKANISDSQICAGGIFDEDTCQGDSGGPFTVFSDYYSVLEGIISYGFSCGSQSPGIYTRVASFDNWIRTNMRP